MFAASLDAIRVAPLRPDLAVAIAHMEFADAEPDAAADAMLAAATKVAPGVSVTMKSVWLGVLLMGFIMTFSGKAWTLNVGFNIVPGVFAAMTSMSAQKDHPNLPQSVYFPIAVGRGVFVACHFWCYMLHEVFMSFCAGFLVALIGMLAFKCARHRCPFPGGHRQSRFTCFLRLCGVS